LRLGRDGVERVAARGTVARERLAREFAAELDAGIRQRAALCASGATGSATRASEREERPATRVASERLSVRRGVPKGEDARRGGYATQERADINCWLTFQIDEEFISDKVELWRVINARKIGKVLRRVEARCQGY